MRNVRADLMCIAIAAIGLVACGSNGGEATPTGTSSPTMAPTTTSTPNPTAATATATPAGAELEAEVAEAYLAYWDAYAEAVLELDLSSMEGFAAGDELERIADEIESLRAGNMAARMVVEHDFVVVHVTETEAVIIDELINNSFTVDPITKLPEQGEGAGTALRDTVHMEVIEGRWVVVSGTRERLE